MKGEIVERTENPEILSSVPTGTEEETVIKQNRWCQIRALFEQGLSKSAIARELGIDPKTVRKWLGKIWEPQERERKCVLDDYESFSGRVPRKSATTRPSFAESWNFKGIRVHIPAW